MECSDWSPVRRLISAHLDVGPGVAVPESSPGDLERRLLLPQRLVQVHDVRLHAGDLLDRLKGGFSSLVSIRTQSLSRTRRSLLIQQEQ